MNSKQLFQDDVHPRLLFGSDDLPGLQQKARTGIPGRALDEMLRRCKCYTSPTSPDYVDISEGLPALLEGFGGGQQNNTGHAIHCLTFGYAFTGDERLAEKALDIVRAVTTPDTSFNVCTATFANQVTWAYDILHEFMDKSEQARLKDFLRARLEHYRERILENPADLLWGIGCNTFIRLFEKYVILLAATWQPDDVSRLPLILSTFRQSVHLLCDEGGAIYEGPGYGWRDAEWLSLMAEVLYRMGVANFWEEEPRFANICRHWAYICLPGKRGQNDYCDAGRVRADRPFIAALLHARHLKDPVSWWVWEQLGGRGHPLLGEAPEFFNQHLGLTVLWEDDGAEPKSPGVEGWPDSRLSGKAGILTMRSGWDDDDTSFSLLASQRVPGTQIHQQVDSGHFSLFALGELFSVDSGYGDILGRYHSVVMPDGKEPNRAPHVFGQMFYGGRVENFAAGSHADYGCVNTGEQWEVPWGYRHAMLVKAPGALPYVILLDNVNAGPEYRLYRWQLNSEPENRIEVDSDAGSAIILGQSNRLELAWSFPGLEQYSEPHRMDVETDRIDSAKRGGDQWSSDHRRGMVTQYHPQGGWTTGLGDRPRLLANLYGYNCQLMTALLPRRQSDPSVEIRKVTGRNQFGLVLDFGDCVDTVVASPHCLHVDLEGITGEAKLAVARRNRAGELLWWAAADAFALTINGRQVLPRQGEPRTLAESE